MSTQFDKVKKILEDHQYSVRPFMGCKPHCVIFDYPAGPTIYSLDLDRMSKKELKDLRPLLVGAIMNESKDMYLEFFADEVQDPDNQLKDIAERVKLLHQMLSYVDESLADPKRRKLAPGKFA